MGGGGGKARKTQDRRNLKDTTAGKAGERKRYLESSQKEEGRKWKN